MDSLDDVLQRFGVTRDKLQKQKLPFQDEQTWETHFDGHAPLNLPLPV